MLYLTGIISYAFINVCKAQLEDIKRRYKEKDWIHSIANYAEKELRDIAGNMLLPGISTIEKKIMCNGEENENHPTDEQMFSTVCALKDQFDPADYLFFKAMFTNDDRDRILLLQQAQMISPENLRIHIITTFIFLDDGEKILEQLSHLNSLLSLSKNTDTKEFNRILHVLDLVSKKDNKMIPPEVAGFLNATTLPDFVKYSLLFYIKLKTDAPILKKILELLLIPGCEKHWIYIFAQGHVSYEMKDYKSTLKWLNQVDFERQNVEHYSILEIQYMSSVALRNSGNEGKAILLLREMLFSGTNDGCLSDFYINAVIDLAKYYVKLGQSQEADKALSKLFPDMNDYLEEMLGENYMLLMAEKSLLESNTELALEYLKKLMQLMLKKR